MIATSEQRCCALTFYTFGAAAAGERAPARLHYGTWQRWTAATTFSSSGSGRWARRPPGRSPPAACGCWGWRLSPPPTTRGRRTVARGSCVSLTFESPAYVPLLRRAYEGWHDLAKESGRDLLRLCGGIYIGDPESPVFAGSLASARVHGLKHEVLDAAEISTHFPTMRPAEHALGPYEANAGYVRSEETVLANIDVARRDGADLRFSEPVTHWAPTPGGGVDVVTSRGRYGGDRLVLAPGAWVSTLLPPPVTIAVERQIFYWLEPDFTPQGLVRGLCRGTPPPLPGGDRWQRGALRLPDGRRSSRRAQARLLPAEPRCNHDTADYRPHSPRRRSRGDGAPRSPALPPPQRTSSEGRDLHVRLGARRRVRAWPARRHPPGGVGLRLLRPRVQVCAGGGRDRRRPRPDRDDSARHRDVRHRSTRLHRHVNELIAQLLPVERVPLCPAVGSWNRHCLALT